MTSLNKPVTRRAEHSLSHRGRRYVIQLSPGLNELVKIREENTRTWYSIPLSKIYQLGANIEANQNRKLKAEKGKK